MVVEPAFALPTLESRLLEILPAEVVRMIMYMRMMLAKEAYAYRVWLTARNRHNRYWRVNDGVPRSLRPKYYGPGFRLIER